MGRLFCVGVSGIAALACGAFANAAAIVGVSLPRCGWCVVNFLYAVGSRLRRLASVGSDIVSAFKEASDAVT